MKKKHTQPNSMKLFTTAEAAAILNISLKTLNNWLKEGKLPYIKLGDGGRLTRIRERDLEAFIDSGYRMPK